MAYSKQTWVRGEKVASTKLNHMEDGIATISANGAIDTANLANAAVTSAKIADGAVTLAKLADAVKEHFALADDVDELKNAFDEAIDVSTGDNLVDPDKQETGAIQANGTISVAGSYADYETTDFIELEPNTDYILEIFYKQDSAILTDRRLYLLYDQNKEPVSATFVNTYGNAVTAFNSGSYKYVRASSNANNWIQIEKGTQQTVFKPFEKTIHLNDDVPLTQEMRSEIGAIET